MVAPIHYELSIFCNGAKLSDPELVPDKREMIKYVTLKTVRPFRIIIAGIITDKDNQKGLDFYKAKGWVTTALVCLAKRQTLTTPWSRSTPF